MSLRRSRKAVFAICGLVLLQLSVRAADAQCSITIAGDQGNTDMAVFDNAMKTYMCNNDIPAAALAISRNGTVIYRRSFDWSDEAQTLKLQPNAMLRLASVSKPITAAGTRKLFTTLRRSLNERAFDLAGCPSSGILPVDPFGTLDTRSCDITVLQLIQHRSGWNRNVEDPMFWESQIAQAMGVPSPPGPQNTADFILGRPLHHNPGVNTYANVNYLFLNLIMEHLIADNALPYTDAADFIQQEVFAPMCIPATEVIGGRTFKADQDPREPFYANPQSPNGTSVFPPYGTVQKAYGTWDHELNRGGGGLVASAHAVASFAHDYVLFGDSAGVQADSFDAHGGSLPGTNTIARSYYYGIDYAVLFDQRSSGSGPDYAAEIRQITDSTVDFIQNTPGKQWPTGPAVDCNGNGLDDLCDIASGIESDANANGYPDACEVCGSAADCSDGMPCTDDICYAISCDNRENCAPGFNCHPGTLQCEDFCTIAGSGPGTSSYGNCDDGDPCTLDLCLADISWPAGTPGICRWNSTCESNCSDGIDNDGDGLTDWEDPDCQP